MTSHTQTKPFLVGREDDTPDDAAKRMGWRILPGGRSRGVLAQGKAGAYRIRREAVGCRAYPCDVAS